MPSTTEPDEGHVDVQDVKAMFGDDAFDDVQAPPNEPDQNLFDVEVSDTDVSHCGADTSVKQECPEDTAEEPLEEGQPDTEDAPHGEDNAAAAPTDDDESRQFWLDLGDDPGPDCWAHLCDTIWETDCAGGGSSSSAGPVIPGGGSSSSAGFGQPISKPVVSKQYPTGIQKQHRSPPILLDLALPGQLGKVELDYQAHRFEAHYKYAGNKAAHLKGTIHANDHFTKQFGDGETSWKQALVAVHAWLWGKYNILKRKGTHMPQEPGKIADTIYDQLEPIIATLGQKKAYSKKNKNTA